MADGFRKFRKIDVLPENLTRRLSAWHLPRLVKAALPQAAIEIMRQTRARVLSRGLPRNRVFDQSPEGALASASMSIVVPIHDAPLVTQRCLASLERYAPNAETILVDDGSRIAQTVEVIRAFSSRNKWEVIRNEKARGHSGACRAGADLASREYLCFLNSDTVVTPWCWWTIKKAFETDTAIGIAGPCTSESGNEQTLDVAAHCRFYWNDSQICAFAERVAVAAIEPEIIDLPWVSGFAFFIRRNLWQRLGGFDRELPDYGNELELCERARKLGYRKVWVRKSYIHHFGQQTFLETIGRREIEQRKLETGNYVRRKHGGVELHRAETLPEGTHQV